MLIHVTVNVRVAAEACWSQTDLDGGRSEAVSPGLSPTVGFKESPNITRHDRRKQDVRMLPL
jgi:hypothetical protein